eukprot:2076224-Pyramimonas_sp.AAC.1
MHDATRIWGEFPMARAQSLALRGTAGHDAPGGEGPGGPPEDRAQQQYGRHRGRGMGMGMVNSRSEKDINQGGMRPLARCSDNNKSFGQCPSAIRLKYYCRGLLAL